jgi:hypothetical protein
MALSQAETFRFIEVAPEYREFLRDEFEMSKFGDLCI